jgi:L-aspartate oxidase
MRYLVNFDTDKMEQETCDVIIVGSGVAGLFAALNIEPDKEVQVFSKCELHDNNTWLAQGGVACAINREDSPELHYKDTLRGGSNANDPEAVRVFTQEAPENVKKSVEFGVEYDRNDKGDFHITHEGGHSLRRVVHASDTTGESIEKGLLEAAKTRQNIKLFENIFVTDILTENNKCYGVVTLKDGKLTAVYAKAVVIATGGAGCLYYCTTNMSHSTGDGIAMAHRAGCEVRNMEFMQFHPTALYSDKIREKFGRMFLISETVRGEGGILRNHSGEAFMHKYHEMRDLAPRDVVSSAIFNEMQKENSNHVWLDITHRYKEYIEKRFPLISKTCLEIGVDMSQDYIPVAPAAHYTVGGIKIDLDGRTCVENLFACGECSNSGVHGANRLAGNALPEGMVFGNRTAKAVNEVVNNGEIMKISVRYNDNRDEEVDWMEIKSKLQNIMLRKAGIRRYESKLNEAALELQQLEDIVEHKNTVDFNNLEIKNLLACGKMLIEGAINRKESCGSHQRFDDVEVEVKVS